VVMGSTPQLISADLDGCIKVWDMYNNIEGQ